MLGSFSKALWSMQMIVQMKKTHGGRGKWGRIIGIVIALAGMCFGIIMNNVPVIAIFLTMLLYMYVRDHGMSGKFFMKQMMQWMPSDGIGKWEAAFAEQGISVKKGLVYSEYRWEECSCLAETEDAIFLMQMGPGGRVECIPVPKWVFKDQEEMDAFLDFCRGRGVKYKEPEEKAHPTKKQAKDRKNS